MTPFSTPPEYRIRTVPCQGKVEDGVDERRVAQNVDEPGLTGNVGADIGAVAAGGNLLSRGHIPAIWLVVPVALLIGFIQLRLPYAVIFRIFKLLTLALFAYIITAIVAHPPLLDTLKATVVPSIRFNKDFLGIVVAILGTTISPYLFFWQASSEVEEMKAAGAKTEKARRGVNLKELKAARTDVVVGMLFSQVVMYAIILTSGSVIHAAGNTNVQSAAQAAEALRPLAGPFAFVLFSAGMIGTGLLAIPVLTGSAAYAVKEFLGIRGSLAERPLYRPTFYGIILLAMLGGLLMNFSTSIPSRRWWSRRSSTESWLRQFSSSSLCSRATRRSWATSAAAAGATHWCGRPRSSWGWRPWPQSPHSSDRGRAKLRRMAVGSEGAADWRC